MAKQTINVGTLANDKTGDALRNAFIKVNNNFTELYNAGGGSANTGDVTFDGVSIIGAGTASGDGNNYSTLELVPDNNLYGNNQYLIIDPTAPNHIHIRAGGVIDDSSADLILGGELTHVKVSDNNRSIEITTNDGDGGSYYWSFGADGKLSGPGMGSLLLASSLVSSSGKLTFGNSWGPSIDVIERTFDPSNEGTLMITAVPANQLTISGSPRGPNNMWGYPVSMFDDGLIFTGYQFDSALNTLNDHSIINNNNGNLNLVTDVVSVPVATSFEQTTDYVSIVWNGTTITINAVSGTPAHLALASLRTGEQLTLRSSTTSYLVTLATIFNFNDTFTVQETSPEANLNIIGIDLDVASVTYNKWSFGADGSTTFPNLTVDLHNGGQQSAQTLQFGNPDLQVVITGPTPAVNVNAQRLIIQGQKATGTGEGGDVYVWGGDAQTNGGDIKIYAGDADSTESGSGGYVNIDGGRGFNYGGHVEITGGSSPGGIGGNVNISAGYGNTSTNNGQVNVQVGSYYWQFDKTGDLLLPAGGDIKNSSGASVLIPVAGQQTYEFDGVNTTLTIATLNFNLLFCQAATGYMGNSGHTVSLPAGTAGQRLVIINNSSLCSLAVTGAIDFPVVVNPSTTAELIYSTGSGITGWYVMYGAVPAGV